MKVSLYLFLFAFIFILIPACRKEVNNDTNNIDSENLYFESKQLIIQFADSFLKAENLRQLDSLANCFEESLLKINNKYPPETDMGISEGENDTLFLLTKKLLLIKEKRHKELSANLQTTDSIQVTTD